MATKTVVCPECGDTVPYGRLSCPSCGSLLASVAGAPRRAVPLSQVALEAEPGTLSQDDTTAPAAPAAPRRRSRVPRAPRGGVVNSNEGEVVETAAPATRRSRPPAPEPPAEEPSWPEPRAEGSSWREPVRPPAMPPVLRDWPETDRNGQADAFQVEASSLVPDEERGESRPREETTLAEADGGAGLDLRAGAPPAGSYLPPSAVFPSPAQTGGGRLPGGPPYGPPPGTPSGAAPRPGRVAAGATPSAAAAATAGDASLLSDLPFDAPDDLPGWFVAAGSGLSVIAFLLPWSATVIGSKGDGGYLDTWGLANASHLVVFAAVLVTLALAILPNGVPAWLRTGVLGLVLGGLIIGLVWPYLIGGLGASLGSIGEAIAGILLAIGGLLSQRPSRHADDGPVV